MLTLCLSIVLLAKSNVTVNNWVAFYIHFESYYKKKELKKFIWKKNLIKLVQYNFDFNEIQFTNRLTI